MLPSLDFKSSASANSATLACGAGGRNRTDDLLLTGQLLCHLSYAGMMEAAVGLEPTTARLTAACSTTELCRHMAEPDRIERSLTESKSVVLPLHHGSV